MSGGMSFSMDDRSVVKAINKKIKEDPIAAEKALEKVCIQFLTWANNGSPRESRKPPIRRGYLRGSSSAFVGSKHVINYTGAGAKVDSSNPPAVSNSEDNLTVTWVWNAGYATKMHEGEYNPGPYSQQDGDAGNKWLEKHLLADRDAVLKMFAEEFRQEAKM